MSRSWTLLHCVELANPHLLSAAPLKHGFASHSTDASAVVAGTSGIVPIDPRIRILGHMHIYISRLQVMIHLFRQRRLARGIQSPTRPDSFALEGLWNG